MSKIKIKNMQNYFDKTQRRQKGISNLILVIIIIAVAVVAVGGVLAYQYFSAKTQPVVQTHQSQTVQTASWKTYTSNLLGIEIKYPSDWVFNDKNGVKTGPAIDFCGPEYKNNTDNCGNSGNNYTPSIGLTNDGPDITNPNYCVGHPSSYECQPKSKSIVTINGRTVTVLEEEDKNITDGYIIALWKKNPQDNFMFEFHVIGFKDNPDYKNVFYQMLSTFKFTAPADQTAGLQTYTNTQYGYQIKLPSDWTGYRVVNAKTTQLFQLPTNNKTWYETDANGNKVYGYGTVFSISAYSTADWNKMKADCAIPANRGPGCFTDTDALGRTSTTVFVAEWPNSGPSVGGDAQWGKLAKEVSNPNYLKNNFSITAP